MARVKVAKLHVLLPTGYPSDHSSLGGGKDYSLVDRGLWEHEATYVGKTKGTGKNKQLLPCWKLTYPTLIKKENHRLEWNLKRIC